MDKVIALRKQLRELKGVLVAYSGGVDSTFLLSEARNVLGEKVIACTNATSSTPKRQLEIAQRITRQLGIRHRIIHAEELQVKEYAANPANRCYFCKNSLYANLKRIAQEEGIPNVLDGTNADDLKEFRPGRKAAEEHGIKSPLAELGFTKNEIREYSKENDLPTWNMPASPCLASRIQHGTPIQKNQLIAVDEAEEFIRSKGMPIVRVRMLGHEARIEVPKQDVKKVIEHQSHVKKLLEKIGITRVSVNPEGYCSGSMNEALT
ncbi:ATP-dependent sacrificial sulfur transferase LarE [Candidatus Micrarchaeota archaeon]|nr:ATP-dependent sacrificial sulfur transferase LarE [Candidatus Micrarchaeota archaeon]